MQTKNLTLLPGTREHTLAAIAAMSEADRVQLSADWLAQLHASAAEDPWVHGFRLIHRESRLPVGQCGFKGHPKEGVVEIAYGIDPDHQGRGYATEAAEALTSFALGKPDVRVVCAHTLPETNASTRVLTKCGFSFVGETIDPEDGLVWRWERARSGT